MTKRSGQAGQRKKKEQRFATLRQRRVKQAPLFAALERRQRQERARSQSARKRRVATTGHPSTPIVERRRHEYLALPATAPAPIAPRALIASVALAFALPILVAIAANFTHASAPPEQALSRPRAPVVATRVHPHPQSVALTLARPHAVSQRRQPKRAPAAPGSGPKPSLESQRQHDRLQTHTLAALLHAIIGPFSRPQTAIPTPSKRAAIAQEPPSKQTRARSVPVAQAQVALAPQPARPQAGHAKPHSAWTLSPDGMWTAVIHAPAALNDPSFSASTGQLIELERNALDGDSATVTIGWSRPVSVAISAQGQTLTHSLAAPDDSPRAFEATARAVGPHLIDVGWTPLAASAAVTDYRIYRSDGDGGEPQLIAQLPAKKHALQDRNVDADARYHYSVVAQLATDAVQATTGIIATPGELPAVSSSVLAGKGMFLYFSSLPDDPHSFRRYDPEAVIGMAQKAGIRVIELRMARGSSAMAQTDGARAWLNRLIDAAARSDISLIAWTVPRRATTVDLAQTVAAASYKTPAGNGFVGLALDLETGDRYMGGNPRARTSMVQYIRAVRAATGPRYLIVATVVSPEMGHHTNEDYPYAKIAAYADVLQPMAYWHYFDETSHHEYARREVSGAAAAAVARTRELAGRDIPVDVAGQSVALQGTGAPSGREILWSLRGAKSAGGIGETFFDWAGTRPDAWAAIQAFDW